MMDTLNDHQNDSNLSYQKFENELINDLNALSPYAYEAINERIDIFAEQYLIKSDSWSRYLRTDFNWNEYLERSVFYFAFNGMIPYSKKYFKLINPSIESWPRGDKDMIFSDDLEFYIYPHSYLVYENSDTWWYISDGSYLEILQRTFPKPLSKALIEKFKKALKFYEKLKELENDDKKWFEYIQKWDDEEFIIQNIEYRIGQNLENKNLWKLYIEFWRLKNPKIMIGVYSRYCSFFLDDFKMKEEYEKEASKHGIIVGDKILDYKEFRSFPPFKYPTRKNVRKEFFIPKSNFDNYFHQSFPFHNSFINFLFDKTKAEVLQKLFMSCKYFFKKKPTLICHRLTCLCVPEKVDWAADETLVWTGNYREKICVDQQSLRFFPDQPFLKDIKNLVLSNSVNFAPSYTGVTIEKFLSKVFRSEIKFLTMQFCCLSLKDYLFLTQSQTVLELNLSEVSIINSDQSIACFEDLMITLPNAYNIVIRYSGFPAILDFQSFEKVAKMSRNSKLRNFGFYGCRETSFNIDGFLKFLKENMAWDSHFVIRIFQVADPETFKAHACNIISTFLETFSGWNKKYLDYTNANLVILTIK